MRIRTLLGGVAASAIVTLMSPLTAHASPDHDHDHHHHHHEGSVSVEDAVLGPLIAASDEVEVVVTYTCTVKHGDPLLGVALIQKVSHHAAAFGRTIVEATCDGEEQTEVVTVEAEGSHLFREGPVHFLAVLATKHKLIDRTHGTAEITLPEPEND